MSESPQRPPEVRAILVRGRTPVSRWVVRLTQVAILVLVLLLSWRLFGQIGWSELWQRITEAELPWLVAAACLLAARFFVLYLRWLQALEAAGIRPPWAFGQAAQLAAILVNHLTPTARLFGGVLRARSVGRKLELSFSRVFATVLVDQVSHQLVIGSLTWLALIAVSWWMDLPQLAVVLTLGLAIAMVGLLIWRQRRRATEARPLASLIGLRLERTGRRLGPLITGGRELMGILLTSLSDVRLQTLMALLGLVVFSLNAAAQWLVFESLDLPVSLWAVTVAIALGLAAGWITGTPGGVATTEAAMVGLYVSFGIDRVDATAGVLLYRGIHYFLVLALGLPALVFSESAVGKIPGVTGGPVEGAPRESETPVVESPPGSTE